MFRHYEELKIKEKIEQKYGYILYYVYNSDGELFCVNIGDEKEKNIVFGNYIMNIEARNNNRLIVRQRNSDQIDILKLIVIEEDHMKINNYKVPCLYARMENDEFVTIPGGYCSFSHFLEPGKGMFPLKV